jgi:hypothetical protein
MRLWRDDAGVVYINGKEVYRSPNLNPPPAVIGYLTTANSTGENSIDTEFLTATNLMIGSNVIAVEIHQESTGSSDVSFDFELQGVFPPPVHAAQFGEDLVLYWLKSGYRLEASAELGPTANWQPVPGGASSPVAVTPSDPQKFYRLRK